MLDPHALPVCQTHLPTHLAGLQPAHMRLTPTTGCSCMHVGQPTHNAYVSSHFTTL
jgi:hypothetical protein